MNMIAARRVSITDDTPGTTRDRVMAIVELPSPDDRGTPFKAEVIDTGGYGVYTVEARRIDDAGHDLAALTPGIESQIARAIGGSDVILFVVDAQAGLTAQDWEIAKLLREGGIAREGNDGGVDLAGGSPSAGAKVVVVANKVDGPRWESHAFEAAGLGFGEPLLVGARNNYNRRTFVEALHELLAPAERRHRAQAAAAGRPADMMLAIVGKRNAGKSTLVNALAGEQRVIVSEIPGTTRDAVDVRFELDGRSFVAIDTAGLRKKKSFADRIEWFALERMQEAIDRCDVALMMVDATEPISQVDQQVGWMLARSYKPCVIVINKWDLAEGRPLAGGRGRTGMSGRAVTTGDYEQYLREELKGLWYAPIAFISADKRRNLRPTIDLAFELMQQARERVGTGKLNRVVRKLIERHAPASGTGAFTKIYYAAQVAVGPPTIVLVVNQPALFTPNYQRFLLNRFREELPFAEVPMRLFIRPRKQNERYEQEGDGSLDETLGREAIELAKADPNLYFDEPAPDSAPAITPPTPPAADDDDAPAPGEPGFDASEFFDGPVAGKGRAAGRPPTKPAGPSARKPAPGRAAAKASGKPASKAAAKPASKSKPLPAAQRPIRPVKPLAPDRRADRRTAGEPATKRGARPGKPAARVANRPAASKRRSR